MGLLGLVKKFAPRDGDVVRGAVDIEITILRVLEGAVINPDVAGIQDAKVVISRAVNCEVADNYISSLVKIQSAALQRGVRANADDGFIRADVRVHATDLQSAGNVDDAGLLRGRVFIQLRAIGHRDRCAAPRRR
jgi:hypothetical protein